MNTMTYKGYIACIDYSESDEEFFGTILNISQDEICFGGKTVAELKRNMYEVVNGHIKNCKKLGIEAEKPFSGRVTYRTTPDQHARLMKAAMISGKRSINSWVDEVLRRETSKVLTHT